MNPENSDDVGIIYRSGETFEMPRGYVVLGNECVKVIGGILYVAMSSTEGHAPILWKDGQIDSLKINGYLSTISF